MVQLPLDRPGCLSGARDRRPGSAEDRFRDREDRRRPVGDTLISFGRATALRHDDQANPDLGRPCLVDPADGCLSERSSSPGGHSDGNHDVRTLILAIQKRTDVCQPPVADLPDPERLTVHEDLVSTRLYVHGRWQNVCECFEGSALHRTRTRNPSPSSPVPVGLDPLPPIRGWIRQWQVENRDPLAHALPPAHHDDLLGVREVDPLNRDLHAKYAGLERYSQVLLDHRVEAGHLLGLVVAVHRRLLHEVAEFFSGWPSTTPLGSAAALWT